MKYTSTSSVPASSRNYALPTRRLLPFSPVTRDSPAVKATDKSVRDYYSALAQGAGAGIETSFMSAELAAFVDTNVLVYAVSDDEPAAQK